MQTRRRRRDSCCSASMQEQRMLRLRSSSSSSSTKHGREATNRGASPVDSIITGAGELGRETWGERAWTGCITACFDGFITPPVRVSSTSLFISTYLHPSSALSLILILIHIDCCYSLASVYSLPLTLAIHNGRRKFDFVGFADRRPNARCKQTS